MADSTLPAHIVTLLTGLRDDPTLAHGITNAIGELTGTPATDAAATYLRSQGYDITADELTALDIARKNANGEPLSDDELEAVAGGAGAVTGRRRSGIRDDLDPKYLALLDAADAQFEALWRAKP